MTNQEIVAKLWNLCNVLRDDGITYHQYVTELTYILFLKMAKETGTEDKIPEKYRWDRLAEKDGLALKKFYEELLRELGEKGTEFCCCSSFPISVSAFFFSAFFCVSALFPVLSYSLRPPSRQSVFL